MNMSHTAMVEISAWQDRSITHIADPGSKAHCVSFAYGALQNGYGRAPQSRPRRQHGR